MTKIHSIRWLALLASSVLLAACAGTATRTGGNNATAAASAAGTTSAASDSEEALKQRAEQRWQYLIDKQAEKAYDFLTPGYRMTVSKADYAKRMNHRPVHWQAAKAHKISCESRDRCTVYMSITYTTPLPGFGTAGASLFSPSKEDWLYLRNQWYYLPREGGGSLKKAN